VTLAEGWPVTRRCAAGRIAGGEGNDMTLSEQIDALQAKVADLKNSLDASRHETNEQIKARAASAKAKAKAAQETVHGKADQAHTQWQSFKADASAKMAELQGRIERKREEHDVKAAEEDAERAEDYASGALDYAAWAVDQASVAVLDAADARAWADARAAASPPS
jgi:chromosome segregation ATPase